MRLLRSAQKDRLTTILDLQGVGIWSVVGDVIKFVKQTISLTSTHYPARGHKLFVINTPRWFGQVWTWIKPLLNPQTLEKLFVLTKSEKQKAKLLEIIDAEELPLGYGGNNETPFGESRYDKEVDQHVQKILSLKGTEMCVDVTSM